MIGWLKSLFGGRQVQTPAPGRSAIRGRYDSAVSTNENLPLWTMTDYLSAKAANSFFVRRTLKIRSRYEAGNNSYFRGIIDTIANDLVGIGPKLQVKTKDQAVNRIIEHAWRDWSNEIDLGSKLRLMAKAKIQDGEAFGLITSNTSLAGPVQLDLQVIESDQVTTPDPGFVDYFWVDGLVLDKQGNPVEYHILRHHPGDLFMPQLNPLVYDRWPVQFVCHWLRKDRPGQVRGVPEITPALELFAQLRRYTKAVLGAAEAAADQALVLQTDAPADETPDSEDPFDTIEINRGLMTTLPRGWKLGGMAPTQPATTYEMFVRLLLREIARCLNLPLNIAMGDSSGYNYSSGRLDHLGYHRQQRIDRTLCEREVLRKVFALWLEEAILANQVPADITAATLPYHWHWHGAESIDPEKDSRDIAQRLNNHTTTLAAVYAQDGLDWEEQLRQRAKELALMASLGIPPNLASSPREEIQPDEDDATRNDEEGQNATQATRP